MIFGWKRGRAIRINKIVFMKKKKEKEEGREREELFARHVPAELRRVVCKSNQPSDINSAECDISRNDRRMRLYGRQNSSRTASERVSSRVI